MSVRLVRPQSLSEPANGDPNGHGADIPELAPGVLDRLVGQLTTTILQLPAGENPGALGGTLREIVDRAVVLAESELARVQQKLESENSYLREEIKALHGFDDIIGDSAPVRDALDRVQIVSSTDSTVLLLGETGTGKELFARAIHERSPRRRQALVRVNCAALPASLIETELFGHERGAFTGAVATRQGRFELANKGTIFLDEIGDLPLDLQAKLLRVVQEGEFERVGSSHTRRVDVRVVAATHRNLEQAVKGGTFREDLYYRLSVFPIVLPSLRERRDDIPRLVWFFIHSRQRALRRQIDSVPPAVMQTLQDYDWPGNVRELENVVERAMIRSTGSCLVLDGGPGARIMRPPAPDQETLEAMERHHIEDVLRRCQWRINGPSNAAARLGLHPSTLRFRLQKLGITRPANLTAD
jgi:formate hydrogenlyase transcriptional activator